MQRITPGTVVVASLVNPPEKVWGILLELRTEGICMEAAPLESLEGLIRLAQERRDLERPFRSAFFPIDRIERTPPDEDDTFQQRFRERVGMTILEYVRIRRG